MESYSEGWWGEGGEKQAPGPYFDFRESGLEQVRNWIRKQRFIPCDLSKVFIRRFLDAAGQDVELAIANIHLYFYLRQEPGPIFRDRNPASPCNRRLFRNLYMVPLRNLYNDGEVLLLTGVLQPTTDYCLLAHFKLLTLNVDYLLWDQMHTFSELKILMDGSNLRYPALLENPFRELEPLVRDFQRSIPITLGGFYILRPPSHISEFARVFNGLRINALNTAEEVSLIFPSSILPFEFGGSLGELKELLDTWNLQKNRRCKFFMKFEERMINDYRRRICHEREVREGGKNWVSQMKLVEDETEFKRRYYKRMISERLPAHPAFGKLRLQNKPREPSPSEDPLKKLRDLVKKSESEQHCPLNRMTLQSRKKCCNKTSSRAPSAFESEMTSECQNSTRCFLMDDSK